MQDDGDTPRSDVGHQHRAKAQRLPPPSRFTWEELEGALLPIVLLSTLSQLEALFRIDRADTAIGPGESGATASNQGWYEVFPWAFEPWALILFTALAVVVFSSIWPLARHGIAFLVCITGCVLVHALTPPAPPINRGPMQEPYGSGTIASLHTVAPVVGVICGLAAIWWWRAIRRHISDLPHPVPTWRRFLFPATLFGAVVVAAVSCVSNGADLLAPINRLVLMAATLFACSRRTAGLLIIAHALSMGIMATYPYVLWVIIITFEATALFILRILLEAAVARLRSRRRNLKRHGTGPAS